MTQAACCEDAPCNARSNSANAPMTDRSSFDMALSSMVNVNCSFTNSTTAEFWLCSRLFSISHEIGYAKVQNVQRSPLSR